MVKPEEAPEPISKVRDRFADVVNRVAYGGERVLVGRRGRTLAVVVSYDDYEVLRALEDREDARRARQALRKDPEGRPLADVRRDLGL